MKSAIQPYIDALDVLRHALNTQRAIRGKKMKPHAAYPHIFDTRMSDGGSFERRAADAIAKGYEIGSVLDDRAAALLSWIAEPIRFNPDISPNQISKVNAAISHLRRPA